MIVGPGASNEKDEKAGKEKAQAAGLLLAAGQSSDFLVRGH